MKSPVYLVIPSIGVGGMEKRLVEVWLRLAADYAHLRLALPEATLSALLQRPDIGERLERFSDRFEVFHPATGRYLTMMAALTRLVRTFPRGSTVHYAFKAPPVITRLFGHRMIFSWVSNYVPNWRGGRVAFQTWLTAQAAFHSADWLDVLNPEVAAVIGHNRRLARKISVTAGGSFADFDFFRPATSKQMDVVFMGRTEPGKNALAFVKAIPHVVQRLAQHGRKARFLILGAPARQESEIAELLGSLAYEGMDILRGQTADPASVLGPAKVFVSLQVPSNYPSKALVEAMGCGCVPVINSSGSSALMADDQLATYIPGDFSTLQLAEAISDILLIDEHGFDARSRQIRDMAIARFRIEKQVAYFATLWGLGDVGSIPEKIAE